MKLGIEFMHRVQRQGWSIVSADESGVTARCRARGCAMGARLSLDGHVPKVCKPDTGPQEITVEVFEHIRVTLKARREELQLTIAELEDIIGMARDQIAKCERENPSRIPNVQTIMEWGEALGYRFAMIPANLPAITLRHIETTRDVAEWRKKKLKSRAKD